MGSSASLSLLSSSPSWLPPPPHRRETPDRWWLQMQQQPPPAPIHLVSTAGSLRLYSYVKELSRLCYAPLWKDVWCSKGFPFEEMDFLQFSNDIVRSACSPCLYFANGEGIRKDSGNEGTPNLEAPRRDSFGRQWTNILLAANVLVFAAQIATQGKLLLWGAKVNSLIEKGQVWRLVTSSFLHANIGHLMVNCFSLNSIGPTIENLSGARRYLSIYFTSAIASSAASYYFSKAPAVGASGAIFGLVGSLAVFVLRHKGMIRGGKEDLQHIAQVILLNMVIGALSRGIDNFGHVGGLLGGVATSWLVGPAWKREALSDDGRRIFVDRAPIKSLTNRREQ